MERLSGFDATFVYAESGVSRFEIASCIVVDPPSSLVPYAFETVREVVERRIHLTPRMRQRLVHVPLEIGRPVWVDDPDFDICNHLKRGALPEPGGQEELEHYIEDVLSRPLDHDKPLWELHVIEGLEGDRVAGLVKTHHAAVDGVAGFEMLTTFLDTTPDANDVSPEAHDAWSPSPVPSLLRLAASAVPDAVTQPVRTAQLVTGLARGAWRRRTAPPTAPDPKVDRSARVGRADAPPTRFNTKITGSRRVGLVDLDFDEVKQIASRAEATINDVIVATVGGAVREYLQRHDELPDRPLIAFVPVSTRDEGGDGGNSTSLMYASMATHVGDPAERLTVVTASTRRSKSAHKRGGAGVPTDLTAVAGPQAAALIGRTLGDERLVDRLRLGGNVVVSNIPGPSEQLYLAGVPVERLYPFGPVIEGNALNVTVLSYKRSLLSLGVVADRKAVPDLEQLTADLRTAFDDLKKSVLS